MIWKDFFSSRANLKRIFLCFATAVSSQSSGNLLVSNYLTKIFKDTGLKTQYEITLMNGIQYLEHNSLAAARIVVACIFFFQAFYTFAWTNLIVTYHLEVVTLQTRAKAWAFVLFTIQVASIFGSYVKPIGLKNIGWKFYIYYSGPTLEELAYLFDGEDTKRMTVEKIEEQKEQIQYEEHVESKFA
ncbi:uncharacterized protein N7498_009411 [Penicillium cinerascens]|uniref:Major facilitator superfamily (MFS) profile domain-containing protein n=1 Tax=Penicillium cinerascens TaxID=70096 RepID=A0A9W9J9X8_9EURO|nr:uncharacterized protein N7498_009411 [Penicillium cinerascens]KAJ5190426.1 hypothetical protein N7498_009411 [Penicillium cinerascens]